MIIAGPKCNSPDPFGSARRMAFTLIGMCLLMLGSGCTAFEGMRNYIAYNDTTNDFVTGWRNSAWAHRAWHQRKDLFAGETQFQAFGEGFRDGYIDAASGGNGCPPPLPPRKFWSWKYQTCEGQAKVAAWFAGFPQGAAAAAEEGAGNWQEIQVSSAIEAQYSPEFRYPIVPGFEDYYLPKHLDAVPLPGSGGGVPSGAPFENIPPGQSIVPGSFRDAPSLPSGNDMSALPKPSYDLEGRERRPPIPEEPQGHAARHVVNFSSAMLH